MEFWGVEVKPGESIKVRPDVDWLIHISQASLGESKKDKGNDSVIVYMTVDGKKFVMGTLSQQNFPQLNFDLIIEKEFQLSHNWKNGSIFFLGYHTPGQEDEVELSDSSSDEDTPAPSVDAENGEVKADNAKSPATKANAGKSDSAKPKAKPVEPSKDNKSEDEDDDSEEDDSEEDADSEEDSEEEMSVDEDSDNEDDDSDSEEEKTPVKAEPSKKRPNDSATKTPLSAKKAKTVTPQKTDGKKTAHVATPHPAKKGGKTAENGNKPQTPKSGGQFSCSACSRAFGTDAALQSHTKAKHSAK